MRRNLHFYKYTVHYNYNNGFWNHHILLWGLCQKWARAFCNCCSRFSKRHFALVRNAICTNLKPSKRPHAIADFTCQPAPFICLNLINKEMIGGWWLSSPPFPCKPLSIPLPGGQTMCGVLFALPCSLFPIFQFCTILLFRFHFGYFLSPRKRDSTRKV